MPKGCVARHLSRPSPKSHSLKLQLATKFSKHGPKSPWLREFRMPQDRHPRYSKLIVRHVECGPQQRPTAGVWGRRAPKFLVSSSAPLRPAPSMDETASTGCVFSSDWREFLHSQSGSVCSGPHCLFRGSRAMAVVVSQLHFCSAILAATAIIGQVTILWTHCR